MLRGATCWVPRGSKKWNEYFCLFSPKGYTEAMMKRAKEEGLKLFKENQLASP